jgi:hypothetical protein
MTHYFIEYDTEYGSATFEGEYETSYNPHKTGYHKFLEDANKAGHEAGLLGDDETVLDCYSSIEVDGQDYFTVVTLES